MDSGKIRGLAARLIGCRPNEFMASRLLDDGGIRVIGPAGKVYEFTSEDLRKADIEALKESKENAEEKFESVAFEVAYDRGEVKEEPWYGMANTKAELVEACREHGLPTTGNKSELLERLDKS